MSLAAHILEALGGSSFMRAAGVRSIIAHPRGVQFRVKAKNDPSRDVNKIFIEVADDGFLCSFFLTAPGGGATAKGETSAPDLEGIRVSIYQRLNLENTA